MPLNIVQREKEQKKIQNTFADICGRWRGGFIELALEVHNCGKKVKDNKDPPIHTGYFTLVRQTP